jgi:hypothetical protein
MVRAAELAYVEPIPQSEKRGKNRDLKVDLAIDFDTP